jgi:hypothetical protein
MACPVCNPLAIPIFGAAGVLSFLAPYRGLIALLSIVLLAITLLLRLRTIQVCQLAQRPGQPPDFAALTPAPAVGSAAGIPAPWRSAPAKTSGS